MHSLHPAYLFGVRSLHHGGGLVCCKEGIAVRGEGGIAAVDVGAAVLAAEDGAFGEDGQTVEHGWTVAAHNGIGQDPVIEGQIHTVVAAVEGDGTDIDVSGNEFRAAYPGAGGSVQDGLGACGQVDPKILNTVFVPTGVGDLVCMDGHGLVQIVCIAAQGVRNALCHWNTS